MHPALSVIIFTTLSGFGYGLAAVLGLLQPDPALAAVKVGHVLAFVAISGGLVSSTLHLGNPQRALRAFSQWRSSWLSREAWVSVAALVTLAPVALSDWLGLELAYALRLPGGVLALATVLCTAMIYAQIRAVPRWNHWLTPALFAGFALAGGGLMAGPGGGAVVLLLLLGGLMALAFCLGDRQFAARGATMQTATGLGRIGEVSVWEQPHTGDNYLLREMIYVVGRRHAHKLRVIAIVLAALVPAALAIVGGPVAIVSAVLLHLTGAFVARWLFFAEAEHVVGLYYGKR